MFYIERKSFMAVQKLKDAFRISAVIIALVVIDQAIKQIIRTNCAMGETVNIIGHWVTFHPIVNTSGSWLAAGYGVELGIVTFTIFNVIMIPLIVEAYRFYLNGSKRYGWIDTFFVLLISGAICSLIDKLFFNGSLDFIGFERLFVSDTKDFYLTISMIALGIEVLRNPDIRKSDRHILREYIKFTADDLKSIGSRLRNSFPGK